MSATLTINSHLKDFPFSLSWVTASTRPVFDSIIFSFVGLPAGQDVNYQGPVAAWIEYQDPHTKGWSHEYLMLDLVYGDSKGYSQLVIQAKAQLSDSVRVSPGSRFLIHFATPLSAQVPPTSTTIASTAWDVRYGLRGRYA